MSLSGELRKADSPIRRFLDTRLGNTKAVQRRFREDVGPLRVPAGEANSGTVGTATDWLLRFLVRPDPDVFLAMVGARYVSGALMNTVRAVAVVLGATVPEPLPPLPGPGRPGYDEDTALPELRTLWAEYRSTCLLRASSWKAPTGGSSVDPELLARACWLFALCTEVYRSAGRALVSGPLARYKGEVRTPRRFELPEGLLALMAPAALEELLRLREVIESCLLPALATRSGPWRLGPTFVGSKLVGAADGDLVAAGLLVDLKTTQGALKRDELQQLVSYALLDFDDEYLLDEVGIFTARYGYLARWRLSELVAELSDGELDVATAREQLREQLTPRVSADGTLPCRPPATWGPL